MIRTRKFQNRKGKNNKDDKFNLFKYSSEVETIFINSI